MWCPVPTYKTELRISCLVQQTLTAPESPATGVKCLPGSSFALASEVCAFYDFSVMKLRDSDSENRNWTVPETWAAVNKGEKVNWLLWLLI